MNNKGIVTDPQRRKTKTKFLDKEFSLGTNKLVSSRPVT